MIFTWRGLTLLIIVGFMRHDDLKGDLFGLGHKREDFQHNLKAAPEGIGQT